LGCLLGLAPLLILQQKQESGTTSSSQIAAAGKGVGGIPSQSPETIVLSSQSADVGSNGGTAFATISTVAAPCKHHGHGLAQNAGGSVFILMVTTAMAVKRVQKFMKSRRKSEK